MRVTSVRYRTLPTAHKGVPAHTDQL